MPLARNGSFVYEASPREPALVKARVCYDHRAGEGGVRIYERMRERGALAPQGGICFASTTRTAESA